MWGNWGAPALAIVSGVIGLAIVAVIVSRNAQTPTVIGSAGSALSQVIGAAVAPVTQSNSFGSSPNYGGYTSQA